MSLKYKELCFSGRQTVYLYSLFGTRVYRSVKAPCCRSFFSWHFFNVSKKYSIFVIVKFNWRLKVMSKVKEFFKELEEDYGYDKSLITLVIVNVFFMFRGLYQYSEPWIFLCLVYYWPTVRKMAKPEQLRDLKDVYLGITYFFFYIRFISNIFIPTFFH